MHTQAQMFSLSGGVIKFGKARALSLSFHQRERSRSLYPSPRVGMREQQQQQQHNGTMNNIFPFQYTGG